MRDSLLSRFFPGPTFGLRSVRFPDDTMLLLRAHRSSGSTHSQSLPGSPVDALSRLHRVARTGRYGVIVVEPQGVWIQPRWWPRFASAWDVARDSVVRPSTAPCCQLFYSFPLRAPGFMAVNYLVCGQGTPYALLLRAVRCVDYLAEIRGCHAIVCQAYSDRLTPRLMNRWGYVQHASTVGDSNYIRRIASPLAQ